MTIKLWIEDTDTGKVLEQLGTCLTDGNNARAAQMYAEQESKWCEQGYAANICWKIIKQ